MSKYKIYNNDCMTLMRKWGQSDLILTDIPYDGVNKSSNGLRVIDKGTADIITFDLDEFCELVYRHTKNVCIIFCGANQLS